MELPCTKAGNIGASRVQLNPVWVMFTIAAFGYLFGVVIRLAIQQYMESPLETANASAPAFPPQEALPPRKYRLKALLWK
jgi:hypothetical protein